MEKRTVAVIDVSYKMEMKGNMQKKSTHKTYQALSFVKMDLREDLEQVF